MNKHIAALLSLVFVVVFLSGCTDGGTTSGTSTGVIITGFSPDISEIYSGDEVMFYLSVENVGEEDASSVSARIFGLGTDWSGNDWSTTAGKTKTLSGTLEASQPEYDVSGGMTDFQWSITSPANLKVDNTYSAGVRLYYTYGTTALGNIKIYNNDYLRSNPDEYEKVMSSSGIDSFTVTDAPVDIELTGLARPLIYSTTGQKASITVLLSNIGQGTVYDTSETDRKVTVKSITVNNQVCDTNANNQVVTLPRSGKKSIACQFTLPYVDSYTTIPVEIEVSYNYFLDSSTSITVLKSLSI